MLEIKDLSIETNEGKILEGINLKIKKNTTTIITGPNGSGKTTLAHAIIGDPKYKITKGKIILNNEDITKTNPEERAKKGIFIAYQHPPEIPGVTTINLMKTIIENITGKKTTYTEIREKAKKIMKELNLKEELLNKPINKNFSGGEKKKTELMQMLMIKPQIAILDEIDSGLDIKSVNKTIEILKKYKEEGGTIIAITHSEKMIKELKPDNIINMKTNMKK